MSKKPKTSELKMSSLFDLLDQQDEAMQELFAKALNLYVSPGADARSESEKLDRLKQAIEDSMAKPSL